MRKLSAEEIEIRERTKSRGMPPPRRDRIREFCKWLLPLLGLYLDDLLYVAAGVCFTAAAGLALGVSAALAAAGACLLGYSLAVARARGGGGDK